MDSQPRPPLALSTAAGNTAGLIGASLTGREALRQAVGSIRNLRRDPVVVVCAVLALLAGAAIGLMSIFRRPGTVATGTLLPALIALGGGLLLAWAGWKSRSQVRFRRWMAAALIIWATGQIINGIQVIGATPQFPAPGDPISVLAAPLALSAVLTVPWRGRLSHSGLRLGLDSSLLGVALALPIWHFGFFPALPAGSLQASEIAAVIILVSEVSVVSVVALGFLRDFDRYLFVAWIGIGCYTIGDQANQTLNLSHPGHWTWFGALMCGVAWPLIVAGLLRYQPPAAGNARGDWRGNLEERGATFTTTVSLIMVVTTLGALMVKPATDRWALSLIIVAGAVYWARELLNSRFRNQLMRELHAEATADPLTGLANRRVLAGRMAALSPADSWCLLTVDLDGFKDVNDLLGHSKGDQLLAAVASRLREAAPPDALVSRIGGDEFAILLPGDIEAGARAGAAVVTAVRQSAADVDGVGRVEVSASVGVAAVHGNAQGQVILLPPAQPLPVDAPYDGAVARPGRRGQMQATGTNPAAPGTPIRHSAAVPLSRLGAKRPAPGGEPPKENGSADPARLARPEVVDALSALSASSAALRVAKAGGRNRVEIYDASVAQIRRRRLLVEERLRAAVETGAITVRYQPIMDLRRGVLAGCEALARWTDPELGPVDPGEFITVAEQTGLVVAIGERVLQETLRRAASAGLFERGLRVSCNVSPVQLRVAGFDRVVQEAIASHGVPCEQLVIEVTEQVLVEEGQAAQTLHRLAGQGLTIAIDDFGTGYSALGYLPRLPADILKIDQSLTSSLIAEPRSRAITRAVVDLGRTVGLSVVVEGVESGQVDDLVRRMGVGFGQGLYYGQAMEASELAAMADRVNVTQS